MLWMSGRKRVFSVWTALWSLADELLGGHGTPGRWSVGVVRERPVALSSWSRAGARALVGGACVGGGPRVDGLRGGWSVTWGVVDSGWCSAPCAPAAGAVQGPVLTADQVPLGVGRFWRSAEGWFQVPGEFGRLAAPWATVYLAEPSAGPFAPGRSVARVPLTPTRWKRGFLWLALYKLGRLPSGGAASSPCCGS